MTIKEAMNQGIEKIRKPEWEPNAYLQLTKMPNGTCGPWATVHDVSGDAQVGVWQLGDDSDWLSL